MATWHRLGTRAELMGRVPFAIKLNRHAIAVFFYEGQRIFWSELGYVFPPFPFIAHSRGWDAEDMQNNVRRVKASEPLHELPKFRESRGESARAARRRRSQPASPPRTSSAPWRRRAHGVIPRGRPGPPPPRATSARPWRLG